MNAVFVRVIFSTIKYTYHATIHSTFIVYLVTVAKVAGSNPIFSAVTLRHNFIHSAINLYSSFHLSLRY